MLLLTASVCCIVCSFTREQDYAKSLQAILMKPCMVKLLFEDPIKFWR